MFIKERKHKRNSLKHVGVYVHRPTKETNAHFTGTPLWRE